MYKRLSAVLFPVMTLLFIGAAFWGYREQQDKHAVLIKAENQYQRSFHDLAYHVDQLHDQLGNTLAVSGTSDGYHRKGLVNVWRITSQAQNEINQLPLALLPFNKTEEFLSHVSNFAYKTALRDLKKEPLTDGETKTMKTLYAKSKEISADLRQMQTTALSRNIRWMDIEMALANASGRNQLENSIVDGLRTVDRKVASYQEIEWGPTVTGLYRKRSVNALGGKDATVREIQRSAASFLGADESAIAVVQNGKGSPFATYTATLKGADKDGLALDYTVRGGNLIRYSNPRRAGKPAIGLDQAQSAAERFLRERGYPETQAVALDKYDGTAQITFARFDNGVLIYPEKLVVRVALDNGEIVGLQAPDYVFGHHQRSIPSPKLTAAQARGKLNPSFRVTASRKALIEGDDGGETLCYEYLGRINGGLYRIDINADTGSEEVVERIDRQPPTG